MRRTDQHEPGRNSTSNGASFAAWLPVLAAMAIMIAGCLSTFLVLQMDEFRPKVGDVVVFKPGSQDTDLWQMSIQATMVSPMGAPTGACTLDPNVMATDGGSLVVEARQTEPSLQYTIHWAGAVTSKLTSNCGTDANLVISRTDLQRLANAAGGFGIGEKGMVH